MKPAPFRYQAASSLDDALALLRRRGRQGAGRRPELRAAVELSPGAGRSLLVDLNPVSRAGLSAALGRRATDRRAHPPGGAGALGAGAAAAGRCCARRWARSGIRRSAAAGTVGGSVAHADPSAELPVALAALDARFHAALAAAASERRRGQLFRGPMVTSDRGRRAADRDRGARPTSRGADGVRRARPHPRGLRAGRGGRRPGSGTGPRPSCYSAPARSRVRAEAAEQALAAGGAGGFAQAAQLAAGRGRRRVPARGSSPRWCCARPAGGGRDEDCGTAQRLGCTRTRSSHARCCLTSSATRRG